ncbi:lipoprotein [Mycobacterium lentiflavum]|uniref:Beta-lactamase family protein n=1 Tax=Mycobacterium lentiflavum TaxID=141349 RepID=A0A0E3WCK0_MYCLN|nr:serine hydrolase domain-containing protein [Mycobacterium lentiflavum]MEE3064526.1 serine hydrolase domain-containing protein [Actinomycetota bacterium]ULP40208.1 beta-lactamase family protein [Mycobacterium lentiflavum]CQD14554.1 lipoprotein [Mycobacterium lentiflavum]
MAKRPALLLAIALLLGACSSTQPAAPKTSSAEPANAKAAKLASQKVLNDAIDEGAPGCSAAVGVRGQVIWTGVRGLADVAAEAPLTSETLFDIASVSKQFTASALLLLVDAGRLTLDDPLSQHLPELPAWAGTVNVGQLMHQTSGIPDYVGLLEAQGYQFGDRTTQDQAVRAVAAMPKLTFAPGSQFEYSNSNYLLLGEIVRRVAREPLPQFLAEQIFHPLGLAMVLDPTGPIPGKAVGYEADSDDYHATTTGWEQVGDGGIQTTPTQLVYWADNYRTGRVGGTALLDAQLKGAVPTDPGGGDRYGAGIFLLANGTLDHDGEWGGFVTAFRVSKDRTTSVAVSCNTDEQDPEALAGAIAKLWM